MAASTPFTVLYDPLRAILGDREVNGVWHYAQETLASGLRAVLLTGAGPAGYTLKGSDPYAAVEVEPELQLGDDAALLLYDAVMLLVRGEDGALSWNTRSLSVRDGGDRKKDLLWELERKVFDIRNGDTVFRPCNRWGNS